MVEAGESVLKRQNSHPAVFWRIILVLPGETTQEAWNRHVRAHPEDCDIRVRIFHLLPPPSPNETD